MRVEEFKSKNNSKISSQILSRCPNLSFGMVMKMIKRKDVKINGKRISKDELANFNDKIEFYISDNIVLADAEIIFEDENIVIVCKPRKIEVISENENCLEKIVSKKINHICYAVHRLDTNTTGLVVFAKNEESKIELDKVFKNRKLEKYYLALVCGNIEKDSENLIAYLHKDSKNSIVQISKNLQKGYEKIETRYKLIQNYENFALVSVELITGKTHQIRAHLASIGHPILGDEKYGDYQINSQMKLKYQCLCAQKLIFHFNSGILKYLDKKVIELEKEKIDFLKYCK